MFCLVCDTLLLGRQRKFCSDYCKNRNHQSYYNQQIRGRNRRKQLIEMKGGKCSSCSYCKNYSALCFHHINELDKSFGIDVRKCSNSRWEDLIAEVSKCILLCANCHHEIHYPELDTL